MREELSIGNITGGGVHFASDEISMDECPVRGRGI